MIKRVKAACIITAIPMVALSLIGGMILNNVFVVVLSESMSPTLNQGDFTLVLSADPTEIRVGDIIVFWNSNNEKIIHRIIEIECGNNDVYFTTKGDNNQGMWDYEKHFSSQRVIGKVYARIPYPLLDALTFTLIFTLFTSGGYAIYKQISRQTSGS